MRVLVVLLPFFVGASLANNFNFKKLIPDVDFDNKDCIDGACFLRNQMISIDRSKTDPTSSLAYNEMSLAYVNTQNLLGACLPNADKVSVADSFKTCTGKKLEGVCVFSNRGWLIKDSQNETVANLAFLQTAFSGLAGGEDAVNKCLKIKKEEEVYDDDYFYEYAYDDYDYYDYLEEGEVMEVRRKREAGKGEGGKGKGSKGGKNVKGRNANKGKGNGKDGKGKGRNGKDAKDGNKGEGKGKKGGKNKGKGNGKDGKGKGRNGKDAKDGNKGKGKGKKGGKNKGKGKNTDETKTEERKFVKKDDPSKKPSTENKKKTDKQLGKLGFSKMPNLSTLKGLECIWDSLDFLLVKCGEKIISDSP